MIAKKTYYLFYGISSISDPALSYVEILSVDREGTGYEVIYWVDGGPSPSDREVEYRDYSGTLTFSVPGQSRGASGGFSGIYPEIINVIYEYA